MVKIANINQLWTNQYHAFIIALMSECTYVPEKKQHNLYLVIIVYNLWMFFFIDKKPEMSSSSSTYSIELSMFVFGIWDKLEKVSFRDRPPSHLPASPCNWPLWGKNIDWYILCVAHTPENCLWCLLKGLQNLFNLVYTPGLFGLPHPYPQEMIPSNVSLPLTLQQEEFKREAMQKWKSSYIRNIKLGYWLANHRSSRITLATVLTLSWIKGSSWD